MEKDFYKGGIVLVILGFVSGVYNFYLLPFSITFFLIGIILVWSLGRSLLYKFIFTLAPILLYIPCVAAFLYLYNYSPTKLILIPIDHVGKFRIIYEESCGQSYDLNNGMKTIEINNRGIAIMREKFDGSLNFKYQFSGQDSLDIPVILDMSDTSRYNVAILSGGAGVHYISTTINNDDTNERDFRYCDFYLYRKGLKNNWSNETIDSLTKPAIRNCRDQFN